MKNWFSDNDIINSDNWSDWEWLTHFKNRFSSMKAKRSAMDSLWVRTEKQVAAKSTYDDDWTLNVNIPVEKDLKEAYMWKTDGKVSYDILPDWQANIDELQPAKYTMEYYLDWNNKENFWKENKAMRDNKCDYGSWIFFTWLRDYKYFIYQPKEDIQWWTLLLDKNKLKKITKQEWYFHPKSINPRNFYFDDRFYWQPDVQWWEDCIYKEKITAVELYNKYKDITAIKDLDKVVYWTDEQEINKNSTSINSEEIIIYHYYQKTNQKYIIVANNSTMLFNSVYMYNDWKLPFVNIQHYSKQNRFRGEWIPERVAYLKAYKSEIFQDILSWAAMNSWLNFIVWNDDKIWQDWEVWWRGINLWRTTWGAEWVSPVSTNINLLYFTAVLELLDKQITADTWINPQEQFDPWTDKVGILTIMEEKKTIRTRSVDENYNIWLDDALTMMFQRIRDFAPALLKEEINWTDWEVLKVTFPMIKINDSKVIQTKKEIIIEEDLWKYWYFELRPEIIKWLWVKIITASTLSKSSMLERAKINEYMDNVIKLANMAALDQTWENMKKLMNYVNLDKILWWINDAYWYDWNNLKSDTNKDKITKENIKDLNDIKKMISLLDNNTQNVWENKENIWENKENVWLQNTLPKWVWQEQPVNQNNWWFNDIQWNV